MCVLPYHSLSSMEKRKHASLCFIYGPGRAALTAVYLNALFCFFFSTQAQLLHLYKSESQWETDGTHKLG